MTAFTAYQQLARLRQSLSGHLCAWAVLVLCLGLRLGSPAQAQAQAQDNFAELAGAGAPTFELSDSAAPDFLPVEQAYRLALEVVDQRTLHLHWEIADGYYLYQKRFDFDLSDGATSLETDAVFSDGIIREDEYFGVSEVHYQFADVTLTTAQDAGRVRLTVTSQGCADAGLCYPPQKQQFDVDFAAGTIAPVLQVDRDAGLSSNEADASATETRQGLSVATWLYMLLLAFIGGSILNMMPCVFPVLSLKVFSIATSTERSSHIHGWVYAAGVVLSFLLVAAVLLVLQRAGAAVGWGFQLQDPRFVALLAYLFFAMGLALSGVVELGAGLMGTGSKLAEQKGYSGSFFTGVLATVVASPCTAPFMGTALGFAVTQSGPVALSIFAALGAGMAAPMLLLSYSSRLRSRMPKPGPWMDTFKQLLAFPLYATAIWLLWVSGRQTSVTAMALLLCGMLALALGLWLWQRHSWGKTLGTCAVVLALLLIPSPLLERDRAEQTAGWSNSELNILLNEGRPVFVNVTADWCITCIANEKGTLGNARVEAAMAASNMRYLVADWTDYNAEIADFLASFDRNGVPLYLVYSGLPDDTPQVLPQLLTPGIVLDAIERAMAKAEPAAITQDAVAER